MRRAETQPGQLLLVFSPKGGVGKSVLAINLAAALADASREQVALVDLDLQFGDLAVLLGLQPAGTLADAARAHPRLDAELVGSLMADAPGRLRVLAAPLRPELADLITPEQIRALLGLLREIFDLVVVDCSTHLDDRALEAVEMADRILLVTDLNLPSIKDAKLALHLFERLGIPRERVLLVVNRSGGPASLTVPQLEANLGFRVAASIPSQGHLVLQSIHEKVPLVKLHPKAEISAKIRDLAAALLPYGRGAGGRASNTKTRRFWARPGPS